MAGRLPSLKVCLSENFRESQFRPFDKLRANGFPPFVVGLSNHPEKPKALPPGVEERAFAAG
jgi:hypothetical protein